VAADDSKAIPLPQLERLWGNRDIPLRERALWRLLYDSAARAEEVLGLDVPDLDLANRQARARVKGGDAHLLHFQTAGARLLAKLIAGRESGPVFLTERRAASHRVTAAADLDPGSGRARLSYEMAEQLFKQATRGKTLHQLRHSRLTHLGDQNVSAPLLMAISGHKQLTTLQQYVKPSQDAVARLMADTDPDRRRR
jgi:integrase